MVSADLTIVVGTLTSVAGIEKDPARKKEKAQNWRKEIHPLMQKMLSYKPHAIILTGRLFSTTTGAASDMPTSKVVCEILEKEGYAHFIEQQKDTTLPAVLVGFRSEDLERVSGATTEHAMTRFPCHIVKNKKSNRTYAVTGCWLNSIDPMQQLAPAVNAFNEAQKNQDSKPDIQVAAGNFSSLNQKEGTFQTLINAGFTRDQTQIDNESQIWVNSPHSVKSVTTRMPVNGIGNACTRHPFFVTSLTIANTPTGTATSNGTTGKTQQQPKRETLWQTAKRLFLLFLENLWRFVTCRPHPKESKV